MTLLYGSHAEDGEDLAQRARRSRNARELGTSRFARQEVERSAQASAGELSAACLDGSLHLPQAGHSPAVSNARPAQAHTGPPEVPASRITDDDPGGP
jgi:hypothetical protein